MSQAKRIINQDRKLRVADDSTVNRALWVLADVLFEIAKKEVDQDRADMPRTGQQASVRAGKGLRYRGTLNEV